MSLVEEARERLHSVSPSYAGSVSAVLSESPERAAFELTTVNGITYVVKTHRSRESHDRELIGWFTARTCGLSPRLLWYTHFETKPPFLLAYERVEGETLSSVDSDEEWRRVGGQLKILHLAPVRTDLRRFHEPGGTWLAFSRQRLAEEIHLAPVRTDLRRFHEPGGTWLAFSRQRLAEEIRWANLGGFLSDGAAESLFQSGLTSLDLPADPELTFIHGDMQPGHVLPQRPAGPMEARFLDFGESGLGDPAWDLVSLSIYDPDRLAILLEGYRPVSDFVEHVVQVELGYRLIRHLSAAHWLAEHELDPWSDIQMALRAEA